MLYTTWPCLPYGVHTNSKTVACSCIGWIPYSCHSVSEVPKKTDQEGEKAPRGNWKESGG